MFFQKYSIIAFTLFRYISYKPNKFQTLDHVPTAQ